MRRLLPFAAALALAAPAGAAETADRIIPDAETVVCSFSCIREQHCHDAADCESRAAVFPPVRPCER